MNTVKVVKSGKGAKNIYWSLLKRNDDHYAIFPSVRFLEKGEKFDINLLDTIKWLPYKSTIHLNIKKQPAIHGYNMNSKFDFGKYEGYEVGIIYSFDIQYIIWCILNKEDFYIEDLDLLGNFGMMRWSDNYDPNTELLVSGLNSTLDLFPSIQGIVKNVGMAFTNYILSEEIREINFSKFKTTANSRLAQ